MDHSFFHAALGRPLGHAFDVASRTEGATSSRENNDPDACIPRQSRQRFEKALYDRGRKGVKPIRSVECEGRDVF